MNRRIFNFFLLVMFFDIASSVSATTYRLQRVTSVESGQKYVFEQAGYVMSNSITTSTPKDALKTKNVFKTTGLLGSEEYVWTLESASDGFKLKNESASGNKYLANHSETYLSFKENKEASVWSFLFQSDGTARILKGTGGEIIKTALALTSSSLGSFNYKCYPMDDWGYQPHSIVVYKLVPEAEGKSSPALGFSYKFKKLIKGETFTAPTFSHAEGFNGTVTYSSSNEDVATVNESTGSVSIVGSGHALITASSVATDTYDAGEATYTIVVMDGDGSESTPYSINDFSSGFIGYNQKYVQGYIVGAYKKDDNFGVFEDNATTDDYLALADSKENANEANTIVVIYKTYGLYSHPELKNCMVKLYGSVGKIFHKTTLSSVSSASKLAYGVTISKYKYATYRTTEKLNFTDTGVSAYTAAIDESNVKLTKISDGVVNTGLGVVLYSETAGTYDIPVTTADASVTSTGLSISDGETATKENMTYVLGKKNDVVGFYRWVGTASLPVGRVYLDGSSAGSGGSSSARDYLEFMFDDEGTTGVDGVVKRAEIKDKSYYDLQGRRVAHGQQPTAKGLYIVNGKKIVIK